MNRQSMLKDIKKWERRLLVGEWLTMTFPDGKQTKIPPLPCNFHRGVDARMAELGDGDAIAKMAARLFESQQLGKQDLVSLRRATRIGGRSAQLFSLQRALALGPAEEEPEVA